ncbi:hypothetical protein PQX77_021877 [Marasmius sp. AFHP31]|nr:hypothetical protein PQX77_021877 [Marasmius sp. AFHP31]
MITRKRRDETNLVIILPQHTPAYPDAGNNALLFEYGLQRGYVVAVVSAGEGTEWARESDLRLSDVTSNVAIAGDDLEDEKDVSERSETSFAGRSLIGITTGIHELPAVFEDLRHDENVGRNFRSLIPPPLDQLRTEATSAISLTTAHMAATVALAA